MLTQRLGSDTQKDPEFLNEFIKIVKENPGSCDEVWLSTDYGFPKIDVHEKSAEILSQAFKKLQKAGIRVSLQISNTVGHGEYMSSQDCSGLVYDNSPVEKMVGHDGTVANYCFCWNGKHFRKYTLNSIKAYLQKIKPYCVWLDDDLRATNHYPVEFGCFCDNCMAKFNKKYNSSFTREELVNEINFGDIKWRERHIEFIRNSLGDLTYEIGKIVHEEAPNCRLGYQYATNTRYTGYNYDFIFDAMYKSTGFPPLSRPGGGSYDDHDINTFVYKSEAIDMQNRMLPDYVEDKRPEIESLPDIVFGKSIGGTCFETSYYLASGNNAMSYAILMNDYEDMSWHSQMLNAFSNHREYWQKLAKGSKNSTQGGFVYAISNLSHKSKSDRAMGYTDTYFNMASAFRYLGFSIAMKDKAFDNDVRLLHHKNAQQMSDDEIKKLLHCPVITDAKTVEILNRRGFSLPVEAKSINTQILSEYFTDHAINSGSVGRRWAGQFLAKEDYEIIVLESERAEIISEYIKVAPVDTPIKECISLSNYGIKKYIKIGKNASCVFTTPYGAKWSVFGFDMWNRGESCEKRNQYLQAAAYISSHRQPAEIVTPIKALLQTRIDSNGKVSQVSITNATVADSGEVLVNILNPKSKMVSFMGQYTPLQKLELIQTEEENVFCVKVPNLKPWAVSTIFFE